MTEPYESHQFEPKGAPNSKLKPSQVTEMRRLFETGDWDYQKLSDHYGVTKNQVSSIIRRKQWRDIP